MKFHANENIEAEVVDYLRALGHDVHYAAESHPRASDDEVLRYAHAEKRVLITSDKDFGNLCFRIGRPASGVILLRSRDASPEGRIRLLDAFLKAEPAELENAFIVLSKSGIRRRTLRR